MVLNADGSESRPGRIPATGLRGLPPGEAWTDIPAPRVVHVVGPVCQLMEASKPDAKRWYKCKRSGDGWLVTRQFIKPLFQTNIPGR